MQDNAWLDGDWMHTYSGVFFTPMDPCKDDIVLEDIAHSLSMQCRYNGHIEDFYSVAQHSVLISDYLYRTTGDKDLALWGLFHDAAEAYIGDMIRPVKRHFPDFSAAEDKILEAVSLAFGLRGLTIPPEVLDADNRILATERAALYRDFSGLPDLPVAIYTWDAGISERMFLAQYDLLSN